MATMDHGHHHHRHAPDTATDPVCGMKVTDRDGQEQGRACAATPTTSAASAAWRKFTAEPQRYLAPKPGRQPVAAGHDLHLPHASRDPPGRARAPARSAAWRWSPRRRRSTAGPTRSSSDMKRRLLDRRGAFRAVVLLDMGGHFLGLRPSAAARLARTGSSSCWRRRWCCGPAGRSSCAAGSRSCTRNLNMFTLIALGTGAAWVYSVVATAGAAACSRRVPRRTARSRSISRPAAVITVPGAARPGAGAARPRADLAAPSARCSTSRRRPRGGSAPTAATRKSRSIDRRVGDRLRVRPGREGAGRRRGDRRPQRGRRIDGHRRAHAGRPRSPAPR